MNTLSKQRTSAILLGSGLMLVTLACLCGPLQQIQEIQTTVGAAQSTLAPALTELKQNEPTFEAQATEFQLTLTAAGPNGGSGDISTAVAGVGAGQWAASATATSQYGDSDWAAAQATGAPNTNDCGDFTTAWASGASNSQDTLTLKYAKAVVPTGVVIHQTYNPGSIVKVQVSGPLGSPVVVYEGAAAKIEQCPYVQTIDIPLGTVTSPVDTVIISLDQSLIGGWDEIDAVQLVGVGQ